ncbi:MAG: hypothetical protein CMH83_15810 [Nocardioides sp.]|nr:hypothetical protein [Nocardioides sp.]
MRLPLRSLTPALLLPLALGLAACGGDDEPTAAEATSAAAEATESVDEALDEATDPAGSDEAMDMDDAMDLLGDDSLINIIGEQLSDGIGGSGYEYDGDTLTVFVDGETSATACAIGTTVLDAFSADLDAVPVLEIEFSDGTETC